MSANNYLNPGQFTSAQTKPTPPSPTPPSAAPTSSGSTNAASLYQFSASAKTATSQSEH